MEHITSWLSFGFPFRSINFIFQSPKSKINCFCVDLFVFVLKKYFDAKSTFRVVMILWHRRRVRKSEESKFRGPSDFFCSINSAHGRKLIFNININIVIFLKIYGVRSCGFYWRTPLTLWRWQRVLGVGSRFWQRFAQRCDDFAWCSKPFEPLNFHPHLASIHQKILVNQRRFWSWRWFFSQWLRILGQWYDCGCKVGPEDWVRFQPSFQPRAFPNGP